MTTKKTKKWQDVKKKRISPKRSKEIHDQIVSEVEEAKKLKVGDRVQHITGSLKGTIISIDHAYCVVREDDGSKCGQVVLADLRRLEEKSKRTYRLFAECEIKATTPEEVKKQFMTLLKERDDTIEVEEQEITQPNIDLTSWVGRVGADI
jgi:heat shock protein HspQ